MAPKKSKDAGPKAKKSQPKDSKADPQPDNNRDSAVEKHDVEDYKTPKQQEETPQTNDVEDKTQSRNDQKRKAPASKAKDNTEPSSKTARRSTRGNTSTPSSEQLLKYLLSPEAIRQCRTADEAKALKEAKDNALRTYTDGSPLNPFEELMAAVILSRPISHSLGHRSIRTVLNDPYSFSSAKAIKDAGKDKCIEAMYAAHTQHKDKTAIELFGLANVILDEFSGSSDKDGSSLAGIRKAADNDADREHDLIKEKVKGVGKTALDIFFRRVQWLWDEGFPFIDGRTQDAVRELGLPTDADDLVKLIDEHWSGLKGLEIAGKGDPERKRRAFVIILERAIGASLEHKVDAVREAAVQSSCLDELIPRVHA